MGKSWKETLRTADAKFRSARVALCRVQSANLALRTRWVKLKNFDPKRGFSFGTLHQWCVKFLSKIFLPVLAILQPKISIRYARPQNRKIIERNFTHHWCKVPKCRGSTLQSAECPPPAFWTRWVKFKNFHPVRVFSFGTLHQWCVKLPVLATLRTKILIRYFQPRYDQLVLLTVVRVLPFLGTLTSLQNVGRAPNRAY